MSKDGSADMSVRISRCGSGKSVLEDLVLCDKITSRQLYVRSYERANCRTYRLPDHPRSPPVLRFSHVSRKKYRGHDASHGGHTLSKCNAFRDNLLHESRRADILAQDRRMPIVRAAPEKPAIRAVPLEVTVETGHSRQTDRGENTMELQSMPNRRPVRYVAFMVAIAVSGILVAHGDLPATQGAPPNENVRSGLDVLERDGFKQLAGRRVGVITNHTGVNREGTSAIQLLHDAKNVDLVVAFSPEHGLEGKLDVSKVGDTKHSETSLKVYSLYGKTRRPTPEMLEGLDALVFDIQDVGARFYTYISTMGNAMEEAAKHDLEFFVLDRPNPIGGVRVEGPLLDDGKQSFVGYHRIPIRHGMTVGELARMFNDELDLDLKLTIVPVERWQRKQLFDETGLAWINPSPNMRSLTEALLYPGIGLLETTNLSVGRGTETPFEIFGAPWLDGGKLAKVLNRAYTPGVRFVPITFTPQASKFEGEACSGVRILLTDRSKLESVRLGLEAAVLIWQLHPEEWKIDRYARLLGNDAVLNALREGKTAAQIEASYQDDLARFLERRKAFLIY